MVIDIITIFPKMFTGPFSESIIKKAQEKKIVQINIHNLRNFTQDKHRTTDDYLYGGGVGMVMKPAPIFKAVEEIKKKERVKSEIILTSPQGEVFNQNKAKKLAHLKHLIFICGHYRGVDERVKRIITQEISIGDFVLTGGELATMVIVDSLVRLLPGVIGKSESYQKDSFYGSWLDYPLYTRPRNFRGMKVPQILFSGNHREIQLWRKREAIYSTLKKRPDLLKKINLTVEEKKFVQNYSNESINRKNN